MYVTRPAQGSPPTLYKAPASDRAASQEAWLDPSPRSCETGSLRIQQRCFEMVILNTETYIMRAYVSFHRRPISLASWFVAVLCEPKRVVGIWGETRRCGAPALWYSAAPQLNFSRTTACNSDRARSSARSFLSEWDRDDVGCPWGGGGRRRARAAGGGAAQARALDAVRLVRGSHLCGDRRQELLLHAHSGAPAGCARLSLGSALGSVMSQKIGCWRRQRARDRSLLRIPRVHNAAQPLAWLGGIVYNSNLENLRTEYDIKKVVAGGMYVVERCVPGIRS